jgi:hypothetical protein
MDDLTDDERRAAQLVLCVTFAEYLNFSRHDRRSRRRDGMTP